MQWRLCQYSFYISHDLCFCEVIVTKQIIDVVTVVERFLHTEVEHLHVCWTIIAGDSLTKAAVQTAILESHNQLMVALELIEQLLVDTRQVAWVD